MGMDLLYIICRHVCIKSIEVRSCARVWEAFVAIVPLSEHACCNELLC